MKCLPWLCLPLKVAEAAKCSRGKFLYATEQKHLIAFWNKCVYFERRCLRRLRDSKALGLVGAVPAATIRNFFNFFTLSFTMRSVPDSGGCLHRSFRQCLTVSATSLPWPATEISQIEEQRWQRWQQWQWWRGWGRKVFGCRVYVFSSVWAKILTQVTFVSGNREDFQIAIGWCTEMDRAATADRIAVCFTSHTGVWNIVDGRRSRHRGLMRWIQAEAFMSSRSSIISYQS